MNQIYWALAVICFNQPLDIFDTYNTYDQCVNVGKHFERSACYPVNVTNKTEVLKQISALNIIIDKSR